MNRPNPTSGLRHVALFVKDLETCVRFYTDILGMKIEWQPDADNYYLCSGNDNLALHRATDDFDEDKHQRLDHIGFILNTPDDVDSWFEFMSENGVKTKTKVICHRDGAKSFYCEDPGGNTVQMIYHPPLAVSQP